MKICYISMTNVFLCPYLKKYQDALKGVCKPDLIYWNRHGVEEHVDNIADTYVFDAPMNESQSPLIKLIYFLRFKHFCMKVLRENKYDKIIFLHNYMGILMQSFLKRHYQYKYIFDIRDYSYEGWKFYYRWEEKVIKSSAFSVISSDGYKHFLPEYPYVISHNESYLDDQICQKIRSRDKTGVLKISFIGLVRFFEQNQKIMDAFGNNDIFCLGYYGQNSEPLEQYAKEKGYTNTSFCGRFDASETVNLYETTKIINNCYGSDTMSLKYALSNKLYYAAKFGIPILVSKDTYMETIANEFGIGITLDLNNVHCVSEVKEKYDAIDWDAFMDGCDRFLQKVEEDNSVFVRKVREFASEKASGSEV